MSTASNADPEQDLSGFPLQYPAVEDRRLYRRYVIGIPAQVEIDGVRHDCAITDLSLGGVAVEPTIKCERGASCKLLCDEFYYDDGMRGSVVNLNDTAAHISFALDQDMEAALTMFLVMSPATR